MVYLNPPLSDKARFAVTGPPITACCPLPFLNFSNKGIGSVLPISPKAQALILCKYIQGGFALTAQKKVCSRVTSITLTNIQLCRITQFIVLFDPHKHCNILKCSLFATEQINTKTKSIYARIVTVHCHNILRNAFIITTPTLWLKASSNWLFSVMFNITYTSILLTVRFILNLASSVMCRTFMTNRILWKLSGSDRICQLTFTCWQDNLDL